MRERPKEHDARGKKGKKGHDKHPKCTFKKLSLSQHYGLLLVLVVILPANFLCSDAYNFPAKNNVSKYNSINIRKLHSRNKRNATTTKQTNMQKKLDALSLELVNYA